MWDARWAQAASFELVKMQASTLQPQRTLLRVHFIPRQGELDPHFRVIGEDKVNQGPHRVDFPRQGYAASRMAEVEDTLMCAQDFDDSMRFQKGSMVDLE